MERKCHHKLAFTLSCTPWHGYGYGYVFIINSRSHVYMRKSKKKHTHTNELLRARCSQQHVEFMTNANDKVCHSKHNSSMVIHVHNAVVHTILFYSRLW